MKQKNWIIFTVFTLTLLVLLGCNQTTESEPESRTLAINNMTFELADTSDITVHRFSLGTLDIEGRHEGNPAIIPAPLDGIIALPQTEEAVPLVVMLHGNTEVENINDRIYAGFDFLVEQLAAQGYAAMSINIVVDYQFEMIINGQTITGESIDHSWAYDLFNAHLDALSLANEGGDTAHGIDLEGRLLLDQLHLIGHSRGGMIADHFYRKDRDAHLSRIQSLIRVGTMAYVYDYPHNHPDVPTAILMSQFDGDVFNHSGQVLFDQILNQSTHTSLAQITYIKGGNHNFFNRAFTIDDRLDAADIDIWEQHQDSWLTRQQQEDFFMRYVAAFLDVATNQTEPFSTFDPSEPQPATMFGYPVFSSTYVPTPTRLLIEQKEATGSATAEDYVQLWGTGSLFNHVLSDPGEDRLELMALSWTDDDGSVVLTPSAHDFSGRDSLSLYVAINSANDLNTENESQGFSLVLTDSSGQSQRLIIPRETPALLFHPGQTDPPNENLDFSTRRGHTLLSELRIPLSYFNTLNLEEIATITLQFDQTPSGAIMISDIVLK